VATPRLLAPDSRPDRPPICRVRARAVGAGTWQAYSEPRSPLPRRHL